MTTLAQIERDIALDENGILKLEVHRLKDDRLTVWAWMREPDEVENASLEWLTDWINRRPLKATS